MAKDNFRWLTPTEIEMLNILSVPDDSPVGYILEVDIVYPSFLHEKHNELPFLPEQKSPEFFEKEKKLLCTLDDKYNYVIHYHNLKQCLSHNLILKKIHRVISFSQSKWLEPYINFNTEKRAVAKNTFEKNFYKLLNNSLFGKSIENIRNRVHLELVNNEKRLTKLISKPTFKNRIIYGENLSAVEMRKERLLLNKPIFIGFTVLELSKKLMYDFFYSVLLPFYGADRLNLLYCDTDSLFLEIFTDDVYDDFNHPNLNRYLDLHEYPETHKFYSNRNKKQLGFFKDETMGDPILEFVGLRPKLYSFRTLSKQDESIKKAKGVSKSILDKEITFEDYKTCLFEHQKHKYWMRMFRSKNHKLQTIKVHKLALSANDNKRYICDDNINTIAYGHNILKKRDFKVINGDLLFTL